MMIKCKPHPLPCIQDTTQSIKQFKFTFSIDLSMGYWGMGLSKQEKKPYAIILAWQLFQYIYLPMGIVVASEFFQDRLQQLFQDMYYSDWIQLL